MVHYQHERLDSSFAALSDATRRGILEQLGRRDASISDLAGKFGVSLPGIRKHVGVLERAGLVTTRKVGRVRTCMLGVRRMQDEAHWIAQYHERWAARFDALDAIVADLHHKERTDGSTG